MARVAYAAAFCGRCGKEDCIGQCPEWTVPSDRLCGTTWVGVSVYGNDYVYVTDEDLVVVAIRREDLAAVAFELLRLAGVKVPSA